MQDAFFPPKFYTCMRYFRLKNLYNVHTIFRQLSDFENGR